MGLFSSISKGISSVWDGITGKTASDASKDAAQTSADWQKKALAYLQQKEAMPTQFGEQALRQLGGLYGMEGGTGNQQALIDQAMQSPMYSAMMGQMQSGEDAIMRNAAATGGLRSGNVQDNLYQYNTEYANNALLNAYNQQLGGIQSLAAQNPGANPYVAQTLTGIGNTNAMGQVASANATQQGLGNVLSLGGSAYSGLGGFSGISDGASGIFNTVKGWF